MDKVFGYKGSTERKLGQRITLGVAFFSYFCAVICGGVMFYYGMESTTTPIFASLMASTVFFGCVGIVLHVLGSGSLPSLKVDDDPLSQTYHQEESENNKTN